MRSSKNDFEIICDEMKKEENPVFCARKKVKEYVGSDRDKYLRLKAEAESIGYYEHVNTMMSIGAFTISVVGIFYENIIKSLDKLVEISDCAYWAVCAYGLSILIVIIFLAVVGIFPLIKSLKYKSVGKYGKYVKIILQEMEQDKALNNELKTSDEGEMR